MVHESQENPESLEQRVDKTVSEVVSRRPKKSDHEKHPTRNQEYYDLGVKFFTQMMLDLSFSSFSKKFNREYSKSIGYVPIPKEVTKQMRKEAFEKDPELMWQAEMIEKGLKKLGSFLGSEYGLAREDVLCNYIKSYPERQEMIKKIVSTYTIREQASKVMMRFRSLIQEKDARHNFDKGIGITARAYITNDEQTDVVENIFSRYKQKADAADHIMPYKK